MLFSQRWKWFVLALLMSATMGCAHSSSNKPISTPPPPVCCTSCSAGNVMTVMADPSGQTNVYYVIHPSQASTPGTAAVAGTPSTLPPALVQRRDIPNTLPPTNIYGSPPSAPSMIARSPQIPPSRIAVQSTDPVTRTSARYDHSEDYTWVMGKLEYLHSKKAWRVRYAPAEVEDALGGCVTLLGVDYLNDNLKDGQMVRVDGVLVDPESRQISPPYQVHAIKPMD